MIVVVCTRSGCGSRLGTRRMAGASLLRLCLEASFQVCGAARLTTRIARTALLATGQSRGPQAGQQKRQERDEQHQNNRPFHLTPLPRGIAKQRRPVCDLLEGQVPAAAWLHSSCVPVRSLWKRFVRGDAKLDLSLKKSIDLE